jgi:hypothetical protein
MYLPAASDEHPDSPGHRTPEPAGSASYDDVTRDATATWKQTTRKVRLEAVMLTHRMTLARHLLLGVLQVDRHPLACQGR